MPLPTGGLPSLGNQRLGTSRSILVATVAAPHDPAAGTPWASVAGPTVR